MTPNQTYLRHSHTFAVDTIGKHGMHFVEHSFSHVHECLKRDGHTHQLGARSFGARYPFAAGIPVPNEGKRRG